MKEVTKLNWGLLCVAVTNAVIVLFIVENFIFKRYLSC